MVLNTINFDIQIRIRNGRVIDVNWVSPWGLDIHIVSKRGFDDLTMQYLAEAIQLQSKKISQRTKKKHKK